MEYEFEDLKEIDQLVEERLLRDTLEDAREKLGNTEKELLNSLDNQEITYNQFKEKVDKARLVYIANLENPTPSNEPLMARERAYIDRLVEKGCDKDKAKNLVLSYRGKPVDLNEFGIDELISHYKLLPNKTYAEQFEEKLANKELTHFLKVHSVFNPDNPNHLPAGVLDDIAKGGIKYFPAPHLLRNRIDNVMQEWEEREQELIEDLANEVFTNKRINRPTKRQIITELRDVTNLPTATGIIRKYFPKGLPKEEV